METGESDGDRCESDGDRCEIQGKFWYSFGMTLLALLKFYLYTYVGICKLKKCLKTMVELGCGFWRFEKPVHWNREQGLRRMRRNARKT